MIKMDFVILYILAANIAYLVFAFENAKLNRAWNMARYIP